MKYRSELINEILEVRGHEKSSIHYESECVETWIEEAKGSYPKLCDYESEWLNYIVENPIGNFPYETVTANPTATVYNVVPYSYKNAILSGSTKYRDIDTGEILETFEEGRNLELVSVKMPVLTTTGKNTLNPNEITFDSSSDVNPESYTYSEGVYTFKNSRSNNQMRFTITKQNASDKILYEVLEVKDLNGNVTPHQISMEGSNDKAYWFSIVRPGWENVGEVKIKLGVDSLEPYKSNILTVNEDVTLRSNGDICDELNLLTGQLTQRIGEDGVVLSQEVVKTVDLTVTNQDDETLSKIKPIEGTMHIEASGTPIHPTAVLEIPVEAITQNLNSFIEEE